MSAGVEDLSGTWEHADVDMQSTWAMVYVRRLRFPVEIRNVCACTRSGFVSESLIDSPILYANLKLGDVHKWRFFTRSEVSAANLSLNVRSYRHRGGC